MIKKIDSYLPSTPVKPLAHYGVDQESLACVHDVKCLKCFLGISAVVRDVLMSASFLTVRSMNQI